MGTRMVCYSGHSGVHKAECGACKGSGKKGDTLTKVLPLPDFDLRK